EILAHGKTAAAMLGFKLSYITLGQQQNVDTARPQGRRRNHGSRQGIEKLITQGICGPQRLGRLARCRHQAKLRWLRSLRARCSYTVFLENGAQRALERQVEPRYIGEVQ